MVPVATKVIWSKRVDVDVEDSHALVSQTIEAIQIDVSFWCKSINKMSPVSAKDVMARLSSFSTLSKILIQSQPGQYFDWMKIFSQSRLYTALGWTSDRRNNVSSGVQPRYGRSRIVRYCLVIRERPTCPAKMCKGSSIFGATLLPPDP